MTNNIYLELGNWTGIGNQMFQYAAALSLSLKKSFKLQVIKKFNFLLHNFKNFKNINYITDQDIKEHTIYKEQQPYFEHRFFDINSNVKLEGYFQHIKYFQEYESIIRHIFEFDNDMVEKYKNYLKSLKKNNKTKIVAVHMRITNIANEHPQNSCYCISTKNFFEDSMALFDLENDIFIGVSNDIDRAMRDYKLKNVIPFSGGLIEDMCLMSLCDHYILSPSTYSWWACFLNPNKDKKIIHSTPFFNPKGTAGPEKYDYYFENSIKYDNVNSKFLNY
jgi:hypothetical protein